MKKITLSLIALLILSTFLINCGGGSGGSSSPGGEKPGVPEIVQVLPSHYIAMTNSTILINAKVLNGNGAPIKDIPVTFTNLSPIGVLSATSAKTDGTGIATVILKSTVTGFATIQAEVNKGVSNVRDRKSVYFTTAFVIYPSLSASIDGDGDGVFDESDDFVMISNGRDTATLKARLLDATGTPIAGRTIGYSTDTTYIDCTIEDCTSLNQPYKQEVVFPNGRYAWTNTSGEATIEIIASSNIKEFRTSFNVAAQDTTSGATDMFTIFLDPVTIGTVTVVANPQVLAPSGTSEVTTCAYTTGSTFNTGVPVHDGTIIQLSATAGIIAPFVQTTNGCATTEYTAPSTEGTYTITATAGGVSGTTTVTVTTALTVLPDQVSVNGAAPADIMPFTIFGGISPYTVTSNNSAITLSAITATATGGTFTATVPAGTAAGTVTLTVRDSTRNTAMATLTITAGPVLTVLPDEVSVNGTAPADIIPFTIFGGISPYTVTSSDPAITLSAITATATGGTFTATVPAGTLAGSVTLTVRDFTGTTATATITITAGPVLNVLPSTQTLTNPVATDTATYTISGGSAPYSAFSSHPALVSVVVAGTTLTATVDVVPATDTTVTITVSDNVGATKTVTLILDVPSPLILAPATATITNPLVGSTQDFTITGGISPYSGLSSSPNVTVSVSGATLTATVAIVPGVDTIVTITVTDSVAVTDTSALTLDVP